MKRVALLLAALSLAACDGGSEQPREPTATSVPEKAAPSLPPPPDPPSEEQVARLDSKDCAEVVRFYLEAIGGRNWDLAARVWDDPVVDGARLEAVFGAYQEPRVELGEPSVEGAAGSLYCTVTGKLTDAQDATKPMREGTLLLRRVNDVPGATPEQLRWTLRSSTFVEKLERSGAGQP